MGWIRIMNNLRRKCSRGEKRAHCKGQLENSVEGAGNAARKRPEHTGEAAQEKADAERVAAYMEDLKEELNFRLLCEELQHVPSGDRVLWVEDILLISYEPAAQKKKPSLWGRMKNCLLGRRAALQGGLPLKKIIKI